MTTNPDFATGFSRPFHGSCPICHHWFNKHEVVLPGSKEEAIDLDCPKCHHRIWRIGRSSTHSSLMSQETNVPESRRDSGISARAFHGSSTRSRLGYSSITRTASNPSLPGLPSARRSNDMGETVPRCPPSQPQELPWVIEDTGSISTETQTQSSAPMDTARPGIGEENQHNDITRTVELPMPNPEIRSSTADEDIPGPRARLSKSLKADAKIRLQKVTGYFRMRIRSILHLGDSSPKRRRLTPSEPPCSPNPLMNESIGVRDPAVIGDHSPRAMNAETTPEVFEDVHGTAVDDGGQQNAADPGVHGELHQSDLTGEDTELINELSKEEARRQRRHEKSVLARLGASNPRTCSCSPACLCHPTYGPRPFLRRSFTNPIDRIVNRSNLSIELRHDDQPSIISQVGALFSSRSNSQDFSPRRSQSAIRQRRPRSQATTWNDTATEVSNGSSRTQRESSSMRLSQPNSPPNSRPITPHLDASFVSEVVMNPDQDRIPTQGTLMSVNHDSHGSHDAAAVNQATRSLQNYFDAQVGDSHSDQFEGGPARGIPEHADEERLEHTNEERVEQDGLEHATEET